MVGLPQCTSQLRAKACTQPSTRTPLASALVSQVNTSLKGVSKDPDVCRRASAMADLSSEASEHRDLLMVRGLEDYKNLPNKSLRLMRYALSSPSG